MKKTKSEVNPGDMIHIYHVFGIEDASEYRDAEGIVRYIDESNQIYGTWGDVALYFDDDWEIIEE